MDPQARETLHEDLVDRYRALDVSVWADAPDLGFLVRALWPGWRPVVETRSGVDRSYVFAGDCWAVLLTSEEMTGAGRTYGFGDMDVEDRRRLMSVFVHHFAFFGSDPLDLLEDLGRGLTSVTDPGARESAARTARTVLGLVPAKDRAVARVLAALGSAAPLLAPDGG